MVRLSVIGHVGFAGSEIFHSVSSLEIAYVDDAAILLAASGQDGILAAYSLSSASLPLFGDFAELNSDIATGVGRPITIMLLEGQSVVLTGQADSDNFEVMGLSDNAELWALPELTGLQASTVSWASPVGTYLITAELGANSITLSDWDGTGFQSLSTVFDSTTTHLSSLSAVATFTIGEQSFVFTGSANEYGVSSFLIDSGNLIAGDSFGQGDGIGIMSPTALECVSVNGANYLIIASAPSDGGSGALTVMSLSETGALQPVDHVLDTQHTRFGSISALEIVEASGHVFIAAAGGDGGLSLFLMAPHGQLVHLHSFSPSAAAPLLGISDIALYFENGVLDVYVSTMSAAGFTMLSADIGELGSSLVGTNTSETLAGSQARDVISGGAGDDQLRGHSGDDVLLDGEGQDTLWGGSGHDIFVLSADGHSDTIADFNAAQDRLDLSDWVQLYSASSLTITLGGATATLRWRDETLTLISASTLTMDEILAAIDLPVTGYITPPRSSITGGAAADLLVGNWGPDTLVGNGGDDTIHGEDGSDVQEGSSGRDQLDGGNGDDSLSGGSGEDTLFGGSGIDTLMGGSEADFLRGGGDNDSLSGDEGDDNLLGEDGSDRLHGGIGNDALRGGDGADTLNGDDGNDTLFGDTGADELFGDAGADWLDGGDGNDTIDGGDGNDTIFAGLGHDTLIGSDGDDILTGNDFGGFLDGGAGADRLNGGASLDTLIGGSGSDFLSGGAENDSLSGGGGNDTLFAEEGDDTLVGGAGIDQLYGAHGNDLLEGGTGNDRLLAGRGLDTVYAGDGDDRVEGGGWTDLIYGGNGADRLLGGRGDDTIFGGDDQSDDSLAGGRGNDVMWGQDGDDTLEGGGWRDFLNGGSGDDLLKGGNSNDTLQGGAGRDTLEGGSGRDIIHGGAGFDILTGGSGRDRFEFYAGSDTDTVTDFDFAEDTIWLDLDLTGSAMSDQRLINSFGSSDGTTVTFDFGGGDRLVFLNIDDISDFSDSFNFL